MVETKYFVNSVAQGDVFIKRISADELPEGLVEVPREAGKLIVAHSETGHHHSIFEQGVTLLRDNNNPEKTYLQVNDKPANLTHERSYDTHPTVAMQPGVYCVSHQRENSPEGWRRVMD